jgi:hypothetical protein
MAQGGGLGVSAVRLARPDVPARTTAVMPKLSMTSLLSVTLLLSNGLTVIPPMIAVVAYGAWRAWYRPAHLVPANKPGNHKSGRGADERVQAGRVREQQG